MLETINFLYLELEYYGHLLIPYLVPLLQNNINHQELFMKTCMTLSLICRVQDVSKFSSFLILPILQIIESEQIAVYADDTQLDFILAVLCSILYSIKTNFIPYVPTIKRTFINANIYYPQLNDLIQDVFHYFILDSKMLTITTYRPSNVT